MPLFRIEEGSDIRLTIDDSIFELSTGPVDPLLFEIYLDPWAAKQAFALYYLKTGKSLTADARVVVSWLTSIDVDSSNMPMELLNVLQNNGLLVQGGKNSKSQFEYRWQLEETCGCFALTLHDSSMALLAVYIDASDAQKHMNLPVFATNAKEGIHRVSSPWFMVGPYNIPGTT